MIQKAFNPSLHPRASNGQFTTKGNVNINSIQQKRITLANNAPLLKGIQPLKFNNRNWRTVIKQAMNFLEYTLKTQNIVCTCLAKQATGCNKTHVYSKNGKYRPFKDLLEHASFIPFVIPILRQGIVDRSQDRVMKNGLTSSEIVCRADVKLNGKMQRIGVSVVVVHKNDKVSIEMISVFKIEDKYHLIKSCLKKC